MEQPEDIRNPVVMKVIHETRKVVNAVIRKYGKPYEIRIEMARDLKESEGKRIEYQIAINKNKKINEDAEETLVKEFKEFSRTSPTRDDIVKYRLWEECGEVCPYSGQKIDSSELFGNKFQVEHIIPYSVSFDNSYGNKTICHVDWNKRKTSRTPYLAFGQSDEWSSMLERVNKSKMAFGKRMRFKSKNEEFDNFSTRQLNDTRYACKAVAKLVGSLGVKVGVSQGKITHAVRHQWGLNRLLNNENLKNRDDHRHHALDALITALISPSLFKRITHISQSLGDASLSSHLFKLPMPWKGFVNEVQSKLLNIIVSHAPHNKIAGAFHEDTAYGKRKDGTLTLRKSLNPEDRDFITTANIKKEQIRDEAVRSILEQRLDSFGFYSLDGDNKKQKECLSQALAAPLLHKDGKTPIKKVRLELNKSESSLVPILVNGKEMKYHFKGNNHHVEIFEDSKGEWNGRIISNYEAMQRVKEGKSPYDRSKEGHKFVMTLAKHEMVEITSKDKKEYYRLQLMRSDDGRIRLAQHFTALAKDTKNSFMPPIRKFGKLKPRKISVSPIGEITVKND